MVRANLLKANMPRANMPRKGRDGSSRLGRWRAVCSAAAFLAVVQATTGCATLTRGVHESFVIETTPAGAAATLSTGQFCTTPCSVKVKRRGPFTVTLTKPGYETLESAVTSHANAAGTATGAANLLIGGPTPVALVGLVGAGVDLRSGAMHVHVPNPLRVELVRIAEPTGETGEKAVLAD